jgi:hypothetical protein
MAHSPSLLSYGRKDVASSFLSCYQSSYLGIALEISSHLRLLQLCDIQPSVEVYIYRNIQLKIVI